MIITNTVGCNHSSGLPSLYITCRFHVLHVFLNLYLYIYMYWSCIDV